MDLSSATRQASVASLPDWSRAGYREGTGLPGEGEITENAECVVTLEEPARYYLSVTP